MKIDLVLVHFLFDASILPQYLLKALLSHHKLNSDGGSGGGGAKGHYPSTSNAGKVGIRHPPFTEGTSKDP